jgi:hypothetical protein
MTVNSGQCVTEAELTFTFVGTDQIIYDYAGDAIGTLVRQ